MKQGMKLFFAGIGIGSLLTSGMHLASNYTETVERVFRDIKITLNGEIITPKDANGKVVEPFIIDGTTYLPVRAISESLGLKVGWDNATSTVKLSNQEDEFSHKKVAEDVIVETVATELQTDNKKIKCRYPKLRELSNENFQQSINKQIETDVLKYIQEINAKVDDTTKPEELYQYTVSFERLNHGKYLFLLVANEYDDGSIRTNKWKEIYCINVETEKTMTLSEMFQEGSEYEQAIIAQVNQQAESQGVELMGGDGLTKLTKNTAFYIRDGKLIIYFAPSQAAATVFGELSFEMPFTWNENGYFEI